MRSATNDTREGPQWLRSGEAAALVVRCARCYHQPGSRFDDGSGVCEACRGSGWRVLVMVGAVTPR